MWDDVIIGEGETGVTTITHPIEDDLIVEHISHNSRCFRISGCAWIDLSYTVMKDTPEGKQIEALIQEHEREPMSDATERLTDYLDEIGLKHIPAEIIKDKIIQACDDSYHKGIACQQKKLRELAGLTH